MWLPSTLHRIHVDGGSVQRFALAWQQGAKRFKWVRCFGEPQRLGLWQLAVYPVTACFWDHQDWTLKEAPRLHRTHFNMAMYDSRSFARARTSVRGDSVQSCKRVASSDGVLD